MVGIIIFDQITHIGKSDAVVFLIRQNIDDFVLNMLLNFTLRLSHAILLRRLQYHVSVICTLPFELLFAIAAEFINEDDVTL